MNIIDYLDHNTNINPAKIIFEYFNDNGISEYKYSFKEFNNKTSQIAHYLTNKILNSYSDIKLKQEKTIVILCYPPGLDFICALIACFKANIIAVPVYPPNFNNLNKDLILFCNIINDCNAKYVLTNSAYYNGIRLNNIKNYLSFFKSNKFPDVEYIITNKIKNDFNNFKLNIKNDDIAYLQYTSGSTSFPKGVMISFNNIVHNISLLDDITYDDKIFLWLPQYHDLGLILGFLGAVQKGYTFYNISPVTFIKYPKIYCALIEKLKPTLISMPNFGFKYITKKIDKCNFSSLKKIVNAAEPIIKNDMENFKIKFNINDNALCPAYGLAEHTVITSYKKLYDPIYNYINNTITIGTWSKDKNVDIIIVDPKLNIKLNDDEIGEIWINSPSKALGYYNKPELTQEIFKAKLIDSDIEYLKTGDLGFINNNQLYITGRIKDLIIIGGRNFYPYDIEYIINENFKEVRPGCTMCFSYDEESIIIVSEIKKEYYGDIINISKNIGTIIFNIFNVQIYSVILIKERTMLKTTSGKLKRVPCKNLYLKNELNNILYEYHFEKIIDDDSNKIINEIHIQLIELWKNIFNNDNITIVDNFFNLGGNSIKSIELLDKIKQIYNIDIELSVLYYNPTIDLLVKYIEKKINN